MSKPRYKRLLGKDYDMTKRKDRMAVAAIMRNGGRRREATPKASVVTTRHATDCPALYSGECECL